MSTPIDGLDPVELTSFARLAQADFDAQSQSLARFLPYLEVPDIRYAYSQGVDALVDVATFRSFDAESAIGRRSGTAKVTGELIPISRKIPLAEYANIRLRNGSNEEVVQGVFNDAARLARGIAARLELARGQLFETGKVTINENDVATEYDAGRHPSLTISTLAAPDLWSEATTADPIGDILAWKALVKAQTGIEPNRLLVSSTVMGYLQVVDSVRGALVPVASSPSMVTADTVNTVVSSLTGVVVEVYENPAGLATDVIDPRKVVLLRDNLPLGNTAYGTTLEAMEPAYAGLSVQPGVVAGGWKDGDPVTVWSHAVAIALPLLGAPDLTLSAQVLA